MSWSVVEHTSDVGLDVVSDSREHLFSEAAEAFSDLMIGLATIEERTRVSLQAESIDLPGLLVAFLSEILYRLEVEGLVLRRFDIVSMSDTNLQATAWGETFDPGRHSVQEPVKAVTYHRLVVEPRDGGWHARFILDL